MIPPSDLRYGLCEPATGHGSVIARNGCALEQSGAYCLPCAEWRRLNQQARSIRNGRQRGVYMAVDALAVLLAADTHAAHVLASVLGERVAVATAGTLGIGPVGTEYLRLRDLGVSHEPAAVLAARREVIR